jgi:hypothetical protein
MGKIDKGERAAPLILKKVSVLVPQPASTLYLREAAVVSDACVILQLRPSPHRAPLWHL